MHFLVFSMHAGRRQPAASDRLMLEAVNDATKTAAEADTRLRAAASFAVAASAADDEEGDGCVAAVDGAVGTVAQPAVALTGARLFHEASSAVPVLVSLVEVLLASAQHHFARSRPREAESAARDALERALELERLLTAANAIPVDISGHTAEVAEAARLGAAVDHMLHDSHASPHHESGTTLLHHAVPGAGVSEQELRAFSRQQHRWRVGLWAATAHAHLTVCAVCSSFKRHADALTHALNARRRLRRGLVAEGFGEIVTERVRPVAPGALLRAVRGAREASRLRAASPQSPTGSAAPVSLGGRGIPLTLGDDAASTAGRSERSGGVSWLSRDRGRGQGASMMSTGEGAASAAGTSRAGSTVVSTQVLPGSGGFVGDEDSAGRTEEQIEVADQLGGLYGAACFNGAVQYEHMQRLWAAKQLYASGLHVVLRLCGQHHELVRSLVLALQSLHFAHAPVAGPDSALAESGKAPGELAKERLDYEQGVEIAETGTLDPDRGAKIPVSDAATLKKYIARSQFAANVAAGKSANRPSSRLVSHAPSAAKQLQMALANEALADEWGDEPASAATQDRVQVAAANSAVRDLRAAVEVARQAPQRLAFTEVIERRAKIEDAAPAAGIGTGDAVPPSTVSGGQGENDARKAQAVVPRGPFRVAYRLGMDPPGVGLTGGVPTARELRHEQRKSLARRRQRLEGNRQAAVDAACEQEVLVCDGASSPAICDDDGRATYTEQLRAASPKIPTDDLERVDSPLHAGAGCGGSPIIAAVSAVSPPPSPTSDSFFQLSPRRSPSMSGSAGSRDRPLSAGSDSWDPSQRPPTSPGHGQLRRRPRTASPAQSEVSQARSSRSRAVSAAGSRMSSRGWPQSGSRRHAPQQRSRRSEEGAESTMAAPARSKAPSHSRKQRRGRGTGSRSIDGVCQDGGSDIASSTSDALSEASTDIGDKQGAFKAGIVAHGPGEGALAGGAPLRYDADTVAGFTTVGDASFGLGSQLHNHKLRAERHLGRDVAGAGRDGPKLPEALRKPPKTGDPRVDDEAVKMALVRKDNTADPTALRLTLNQRMARSKMTYAPGRRAGQAEAQSDVVRGVLAFSGARAANARAKRLQVSGLAGGEIGPRLGRTETPGTTPVGTRLQSNGRKGGTDLVDSDEETEDLLRDLQLVARFSVYDGQPAKLDEMEGSQKAIGQLNDYSAHFLATAGDPNDLTALQEEQLVVGRGRASAPREGQGPLRKARRRPQVGAAGGSRRGGRGRSTGTGTSRRRADRDAKPLPPHRETQLIPNDSSVHPEKPGQPTSALARSMLELEQAGAAERERASRKRPADEATDDAGGIVSDDTIALAQQFTPSLVPILRHGASLAKLRESMGRKPQRIRKGVLRELQAGPALMGSKSLTSVGESSASGSAGAADRKRQTSYRTAGSSASLGWLGGSAAEDDLDSDEAELFAGHREAPKAYRPDLEALGRQRLIAAAKARWEDPLEGGKAPHRGVDGDKVQGVTAAGTLDKAEPLVWWRMRRGQDTGLATDFDLHRRRILAVIKGKPPRGGRLDSPRDDELEGERLVPRDKLFTDGSGNAEMLRPTLPVDILHIPGPAALVAAARAEREAARAARGAGYTAGQRPPGHLTQEEAEAARTAAGWTMLRAGAGMTDGQTYNSVLRASDEHGRLIYPRLTSSTQTTEANRRLQQEMSPRSDLGAASSARSSDASTVMTPRLRDSRHSQTDRDLPQHARVDPGGQRADIVGSAAPNKSPPSLSPLRSPVGGGIAFFSNSRSRHKPLQESGESASVRIARDKTRQLSSSELEPEDSITWRQSRRFRVHSMMVAEAGGDPELERNLNGSGSGEGSLTRALHPDQFLPAGAAAERRQHVDSDNDFETLRADAAEWGHSTGVVSNGDGWAEESGPADWHAVMMHAARHAETGGVGSSLAAPVKAPAVKSILRPRTDPPEQSGAPSDVKRSSGPEPGSATPLLNRRRKRVSIVLDKDEAADALDAAIQAGGKDAHRMRGDSGTETEEPDSAPASPRVPADVLVGRLPLSLRPSTSDAAAMLPDGFPGRSGGDRRASAVPGNPAVSSTSTRHGADARDSGEDWVPGAPSSRVASSRQSLASSRGVPQIGLSDSSRAPTSGLRAMGRMVVGELALGGRVDTDSDAAALSASRRSSKVHPQASTYAQTLGSNKTPTRKRKGGAGAVTNGLFVPRMAPRVIKRTALPLRAMMRSTM